MKENIKLVLVDIDGTLLNDQHQVSTRTIQAISKLSTKGIQFGIATGRTPVGVIKRVKEWGLEPYTDLIMGFNGGSTYNMKTKEFNSCYLLEGKYIQEIKDEFNDFDINMAIYDQDECHVLKEDEKTKAIAIENKLQLVVDDFSHYATSSINKLLIVAKPEVVDQCEKHYLNHVHTSHYRAVRSTPILLEFLNPELSKSKGIEMICQNMNITMDQVLTFGDELNDTEMIRDCIGVAMANANPKIKEIAKYITDSNNDDGVATFIEKNLL